MDLALCDFDLDAVRALGSRPGLLELVDEYMAVISEGAVAPVAEPRVTYGSLSLPKPAAGLQRVPATDAVVERAGAPRAFSRARPLTGTEWRVDWPELWRDWAGAAF